MLKSSSVKAWGVVSAREWGINKGGVLEIGEQELLSRDKIATNKKKNSRTGAGSWRIFSLFHNSEPHWRRRYWVWGQVMEKPQVEKLWAELSKVQRLRQVQKEQLGLGLGLELEQGLEEGQRPPRAGHSGISDHLNCNRQWPMQRCLGNLCVEVEAKSYPCL